MTTFQCPQCGQKMSTCASPRTAFATCNNPKAHSLKTVVMREVR